MSFNASRASRTSTAFGSVSRPVTPSDTVDIEDGPVKAVVCLTGGNISLVPAGNDPAVHVDFVNVSAGFVPPFQVRRVRATGTTATIATIEN